jgi:hypothetical protein
MSGAPQVAMRIASQIWQIFFASRTVQVFCFSFANPSNFLFGPSQKGTICSSVNDSTGVVEVINNLGLPNKLCGLALGEYLLPQPCQPHEEITWSI